MNPFIVLPLFTKLHNAKSVFYSSKSLFLVDTRLYVKVDCTYDCTLNMFCSAKLGALHGFTKGVSEDVSYL